MNFNTLREYLEIARPDENDTLCVPDVDNPLSRGMERYRYLTGMVLHHGQFLPAVADGRTQCSLVFVESPLGILHAMVMVNVEDHEGLYQEFYLVDELLECVSWDEFRDQLYSVEIESEVDLSMTNVDQFLDLMPEWFATHV